MGAGCCEGRSSGHELNDASWKRALWIALAVNAGMFGTELVVGITAGSSSLQADALDFLGDAANYAISLAASGLALRYRARAALAKGLSLVALALWVLGSTAWNASRGHLPQAEAMGVVGLLALLANLGVAILLYRYRNGDANRQSVWICSRNDAIGNVAVMAAALGVFGTGTGWPDIGVATFMGALGLWGGAQITRMSLRELQVVSTEECRLSSASPQGLQPHRTRL